MVEDLPKVTTKGFNTRLGQKLGYPKRKMARKIILLQDRQNLCSSILTISDPHPGSTGPRYSASKTIPSGRLPSFHCCSTRLAASIIALQHQQGGNHGKIYRTPCFYLQKYGEFLWILPLGIYHRLQFVRLKVLNGVCVCECVCVLVFCFVCVCLFCVCVCVPS